jgi:outer membrane protein assembly factor BamD
LYPVVVILLWMFGGCSSQEATQTPGAEERFAAAMVLFNDEDYREAIEAFRVITLQYQGSAVADDAQFYLAESHYRAGEYVLAAYEYEMLYKTMPTSEYVPSARFQRAMCFRELSPGADLDQKDTRKAIDEFQAFIEYHPTDPRVPTAEQYIRELNTKLAEKDYNSGLIYMKMEYFKSAVIYFDLVLERYHDTPYAEPALLKKAEALYRRKRYSEARREIELFLRKYPESALRSEAEQLVSTLRGITS